MRTLLLLVCVSLAAGARESNITRNRFSESVDVFGVPIYSGAASRPEVARAVEAYYQPAVPATQGLTVGVFETPDSFDAVYQFYGSRMDSGKWGWRKKTRTPIQQTATLKFMRAQLLAQRAIDTDRLPEVFTPLFGEPTLGQEEFSRKLDELLDATNTARFQIGEGTRTIRDGPAGGQVRVTIERPYLDLTRMALVDTTRLILVKVSPNRDRGVSLRPPND